MRGEKVKLILLKQENALKTPIYIGGQWGKYRYNTQRRTERYLFDLLLFYLVTIIYIKLYVQLGVHHVQ
jgi:hypothetical protein